MPAKIRTEGKSGGATKFHAVSHALAASFV
jgi:hypothetical protein